MSPKSAAPIKIRDIPRYQQIAADLISMIRNGPLRVGDELPTEWQLCGQYEVSRSTAREALRQVELEGLISRQRGATSRVITVDSPLHYSVMLGTEHDILRYTEDTLLDLTFHSRAVSARVASVLELPDGDQWYSASGLRWSSQSKSPIALTNVYVLASYGEVFRSLCGPASGAIFSRICATHGLRLSRIDQTVTAAKLRTQAARKLGCPAGDPALRIVRRFFAVGVGMFEVSDSLHPADRFAYELRLERSPERQARHHR
jgi:DNA-binding GntR family transcriptional regulator